MVWAVPWTEDTSPLNTPSLEFSSLFLRMLDLFLILHKGGRILWKPKGSMPLKGSPVNQLIQQVLLQERGGENLFTSESYALKWELANDLDLLFVVCSCCGSSHLIGVDCVRETLSSCIRRGFITTGERCFLRIGEEERMEENGVFRANHVRCRIQSNSSAVRTGEYAFYKLVTGRTSCRYLTSWV